jgi:hypothetical protein
VVLEERARRTRGRRRGRECTPPCVDGSGRGQPGAGRVRGGGPADDAITWFPGRWRELDLIIARRYQAHVAIGLFDYGFGSFGSVLVHMRLHFSESIVKTEVLLI